MPNDDLIRREDVKAKKVYCLERHEYVVPVAEIDWLPAAPQPMSAYEFLYQRARLRAECGFPFIPDLQKLKAAVDFMQKWAQEHPDKVSEGGKEE